MERKIWVRTKGSTLYPNTYIILVAPPGVGKSNVLSTVENLLRAVPNIFVAPSSLTTASLIDSIALAKRQIVTPGHLTATTEFHSLQAVASELGVFLPAYDPSYMNTLTKLYDGEHYEERRRTGKVNHLIIEYPLLSIIGGTTPSYLNSFLPEGGWDQGFTSRTIFVFSNHILKTPIWGDEAEHERIIQLGIDLIADLKTISQAYGRMEWSEDCKMAITDWDNGDLKPIPDHAKLLHYNSRRLAHCIKLCMVASMARSSDRFITLEDFFTARSWLLDVERHMTDIFQARASGIDSMKLEDCVFFIKKLYYRDGKKPVSETLVYSFLRDRMPVHNIERSIEIMIRSGDIKRVLVNALSCYIPTDSSS